MIHLKKYKNDILCRCLNCPAEFWFRRRGKHAKGHLFINTDLSQAQSVLGIDSSIVLLDFPKYGVGLTGMT